MILFWPGERRLPPSPQIQLVCLADQALAGGASEFPQTVISTGYRGRAGFSQSDRDIPQDRVAM